MMTRNLTVSLTKVNVTRIIKCLLYIYTAAGPLLDSESGSKCHIWWWLYLVFIAILVCHIWCSSNSRMHWGNNVRVYSFSSRGHYNCAVPSLACNDGSQYNVPELNTKQELLIFRTSENTHEQHRAFVIYLVKKVYSVAFNLDFST